MPNKHRSLIGALCLLYAALRVWRLTDVCLWFDEIFGVHAAAHSWSGIWGFVAQDLIHPPLFYALLKMWIGIGGEGLLWLRLFPVFFAVLTLVPFLYLCKELKLSTSTTALALIFLAVNGSLLKYAQEVRMYSLLLCLSAFSIWLFTRFFFRGKNIWVLTLVNILLVHTHYFGWLVVLCEVIAIGVLQRIKIRHALVMAGITGAAFLPWVIAVIQAANAGSEVSQNIGWIKRPGLKSVIEMGIDLIEPFYFQVSSVDPTTVAWVSLPTVVLLVAAAIVWTFDRKGNRERHRSWLLAIFVFVPVFTAILASWISPYSVWGARHLISVFPPAAILFAMFITEISDAKMRWSIVAAILTVFAAAGVRFAYTPTQGQIWCAWNEFGARLRADGKETIYVFEDLSAYHLWFATRRDPGVKIVKVDGLPGMIEDRAYFLPRGFDGVARTGAEGITGDKFRIAFRDMRWDERHPPLVQIREMGYQIGEPAVIEAGGMKAFLVEVTRP